MGKFNKQRFMKYRLIPLVTFCFAITLSLLSIFVTINEKSIPQGLVLTLLITNIMMWAVAIDNNNDEHHRELRDILKDLKDGK